MTYKHKSAIGPTGNTLLTMVDTSGHTDFGSEVIRSFAFAQGAVILFNAVRVIQAQSWNAYEHTMKNNITLVRALTKIDLHNADYVLNTPAWNRIDVEDLLHTVCTDVPSFTTTSPHTASNITTIAATMNNTMIIKFFIRM